MGRAVLAIAMTACSWARLSSPPATPTPTTAPCTRESTAPLVDSVLSIVAYTGSLVALTWLVHARPENPTGAIAGSGVLAISLGGVAFTASARHGERVLDACAGVQTGRP